MQINASTPSLLSYSQNLASSQKAMQQLATGKKINSAADDPAVLAILSGMQGQVGGLDQASDNTRNSISLLNTAEGAMGDSSSILQDMRTLTVQAGNGTLTDGDRAAIQQQMNQLSAQLDTNARSTQFNGINTNDGSLTNFVTQTGANSGQTVTTSISDTSAAALGINNDVSTQAAATNSLGTIDNGLQQISSDRTELGAVTSSLQFSADNTNQSSINLQSAASTMGDADIAKEASLFSASSIKLYASVMVLAKQMNQQKGIISLLA